MQGRTLVAIGMLLCGAHLSTLPAIAQRAAIRISEAEEESVREAAIDPAGRVLVYQTIIETRIRHIQDVLRDKRAQGRREDLHQYMQDIAGLVTELEDNMDDYDHAHRDLRKPLPKLSDALERWKSVLKQPPDDDAYNLARKLALEAVVDLQKEATDLLPAQKAYFKDHSPVKDEPREGAVVGARE